MRRCVAVVAWVLCVAGTASAQPVPAGTSQSTMPPAPVPYPFEYAARPLTLPCGAFEGSAQADWTRNQNYDQGATKLDVLARYSLGAAEIGASAKLLLAETPDNHNERLSSVAAGGRYAITPDLQVGGEVLLARPTNFARDLIPRATITSRHHLAPHSTIDLLGTVAFRYQLYDSSINDHVGEVGTKVRVIAQVHPRVAALAEAGVTVIETHFPAPGGMSEWNALIVPELAMGAVITTTRSLDFTPRITVPSNGVVELLVGVTARFLP